MKSKYQLFKKFVKEHEFKISNTLYDYILAINNTKKQINILKQHNNTLDIQIANKYDYYKKYFCKKYNYTETYFSTFSIKQNYKYNQFIIGYKYFVNNAYKIKSKNNKVITYLLLKLAFLNLMLEYVIINHIIYISYYSASYLGYELYTKELAYKGFEYICDILRKNNFYLTYDKIIFVYHDALIPVYIYKLFKDSYEINLNNYILKCKRDSILHQIPVISVNKVYLIVDRFIFYVKRRIELEMELNRLNDNFTDNFSYFNDNILNDITNNYSTIIDDIKNLALSCKGL